jgi:glycosyltransferase involved in cell wall biosynthesis
VTRSVAHFIDTTAFSGAERALLHVLQALDRRSWRPILFHHDAPGLRPLIAGATAAGVEHRTVASMRGLRGALSVPLFARALRRERPDVFHAHLNWPLACSGGILAAASAHVPAIVATVQLFSDLPDALTMPLQRRIVTRAVGRYVAVSRGVFRDVEQTLRVPPSRIRLVPNSVDLATFQPAPLPDPAIRLQMAGRTDLPIALTLARLDRQKGLTYLIRAAVRTPNVAFVIAGDGPEREALERETRARGVSDRVRFVGFRSDVAALLANSDLFVLPSLIEGLPLSVLEAMAACRPVVATAISGTDEVVRHRITGLLVPPSDPDVLAGAIQEIVRDQALAGRLARAGYDLVKRDFTTDAMARSIMAVYDELLDERSMRHS